LFLLVDAGVDSVLKGDESGLGTYGEDLLSFLAIKNLKVKHKFIMCIGLSTEARIGEEDFLKVNPMLSWFEKKTNLVL
jgi:hypothetical protein